MRKMSDKQKPDQIYRRNNPTQRENYALGCGVNSQIGQKTYN